MGIKLITTLDKDRTKPGETVAFAHGNVVGRWPVLGKADDAMAARNGNQERNPLLPFGDTPTGIWSCARGRKMDDQRAYGLHAVIWLWPRSGDGVVAYARRFPDGRAKPARVGIWAHGGAPAANGALRPTYGCLRRHDEHMAEIWRLTARYGPLEIEEIREV